MNLLLQGRQNGPVSRCARLHEPAAYPGCIVIAAGGLKPVDADASLFSFVDVFRYDVNGLALDLDAVSLRFEKRTASNKSPRKPNKAMLARIGKLANHLKDVAMAFMRALRNGNEDSYAQVAADMKNGRAVTR